MIVVVSLSFFPSSFRSPGEHGDPGDPGEPGEPGELAGTMFLIRKSCFGYKKMIKKVDVR